MTDSGVGLRRNGQREESGRAKKPFVIMRLKDENPNAGYDGKEKGSPKKMKFFSENLFKIPHQMLSMTVFVFRSSVSDDCLKHKIENKQQRDDDQQRMNFLSLFFTELYNTVSNKTGCNTVGNTVTESHENT